jgi:glutamate dehydrogenase
MIAALTRQMGDSMLETDGALPPAECEEAALFVLAAAARREAGSGAIVVESGAQGRRLTRIAIINPDMPFLVDSIAGTIAAEGLSIDRLMHPVSLVRRDAEGALIEIAPRGKDAEGGQRESMIYIETARIDARQRKALSAALSATLADVHAAVEDWPKLRAAMTADAQAIDDAEGAALLNWLDEGMLTQLGHVTVRRDGSQAMRLGICRRNGGGLLSESSYRNAIEWFEQDGGKARAVPLVIKSNRSSNVHRRVPLDLFIVPVTENGEIAALSVHAGVWTSAALATPPDRVPQLRTRLAAIMEKHAFAPNGHDGKALVHALTALPHDLLAGFPAREVERIALTMMSLTDRPRPRLALVETPLRRHLYAFAWLPRELVSNAVRGQVEKLLIAASGGVVLDWSLNVDGGALATLRFVIDIRNGDPAPDEGLLDSQLQTLLRGWNEAVEAELAAQGEEAARAAALAMRFASAFPAAYRLSYGPTEAARDIHRLRNLVAHEPGPGRHRDARLYHLDGDAPDRLRLKIYQLHGDLPLSDAVPALENFGFRVLAEVPTPLDGGETGTIHDFTLALDEGQEVRRLLARSAEIEQALAAVLNDMATNDPFNRLVIAADLSARETNGLRAVFSYLRQAGANFAMLTAVQALAGAPRVARGLIDLFIARHDPDFTGDRGKAQARAENLIREALAGVGAINDDRLLRLYHSVIGAILRTNAFAPSGQEALAFKLDSSLVPKLPRPVPWREIFVYSRRVEGIHLRAGPVARGGIRWSDRRDDYRTEILGLMKAQRVKNAVIVPTGAKGGFFPKQLPDPARDRDGWAAEGQASYEIFIRSLLSLTDNIDGQAVVHPARVVVHDGDDPYFVVAADKGTARFSDVANALAEADGFWLDDAFASGGSHGYDHKAMGITARGAWISVQRHFLEMGVNVQKEPVRVVGCGDMSGDVFGNGMLLSKAIKLVAAFDHRHIFIDPDPDPSASWKERKRLFALPRSSWADYDAKLIGKGGGVFARSEKRIPLSKQMRRLLDVEVKEMEPDALIAALLKAPVDLLWFGGIGTYVKSSTENNVAVGDPANDTLRVDGRDIRARAIGEGANLGVTQAGRIEFALLGAEGRGGRINADFIDNSAGVDCSDNEVNIKIALAAARRGGKLSESRRNAVLAEMTNEVAELVLEDNRLQTLALSVAEQGGAGAIPAQVRLIEMLEERGALDRQSEGLADNDLLARRAADGLGLTRPELAVLLSSAKLAIQASLEQSEVPNDPGLEEILLGAFPETLRAGFCKYLLEHRLRREIIATELANMVINRLGPVHPFELAEEEGASLADVAAAFFAAARLFGLPAIWARLDSAAMPEGGRLLAMDRLALAVRNHMADLLRTGAGTLPSATLESRLAAGVETLKAEAAALLGTDARTRSSRLQADLRAAGVPEPEAAAITCLFDLDGAIGLAGLARDCGLAPARLAAAFIALGEEIGLDWVQGTAATMDPSDPWERLLVAGLARDFQQMRIEFLRRLLQGGTPGADPLEALDGWRATHALSIEQFRAMIARAQRATPVQPSMLAQIAGQGRNLLSR